MIPNRLTHGKDFIHTINLGDVIACYMDEYVMNHGGYKDYHQFMDGVIEGHLNSDIPIFGIEGEDGNTYFTSLLRLSRGDWDNMYLPEVNMSYPSREVCFRLTTSSRYLDRQYVPISKEYRDIIYTAIDNLSQLLNQKVDYSRFVDNLYETYKFYNSDFGRIVTQFEGRFQLSDLSW